MEQITRAINWNVAGWMTALLYGGAFAAIALSLLRLLRRVRVWRAGIPEETRPSWGEVAGNLARWLSGRGKMGRDRFAAVMHSLILWGFAILFVGTTLVFLEEKTPLHFFYGTFYVVASFFIDLGGAGFLVGLAMAAYRRWVVRTPRLKSSGMATGLLALLIGIGLSGFALEAARIAVDLPRFERASVVGYPLALLLRALGLTRDGLHALHRTLWTGHAVITIGFFALATSYFFRHVVVSGLAVALARRRNTGALRPYPLLASETVGTARPVDMRFMDLLEADACTSCGRCTSVCPATAAGKALDPRGIILGLQSLIGQVVTGPSNGAKTPSALDTIEHQAIWDCTTCGACNAACPVDISVFDKIIDLRRQMVDLGAVSAAGGSALEGVAARRNPWSYPPAQRSLWREALRLPVLDGAEKRDQGGAPKPEWIYWIGCAGAFEPTAQSISRSTAALFKAAGLDFAVLASESCTGDPARRLGDEALFQTCRSRNLETLRATGVRKIVTHCPHCLNTFKNEYQQDGRTDGKPELEVVHHTQLIRQLLDEKKITLRQGGQGETKVTFHDPCYLGRHNGEYDAPRSVVDAVPGLRRVEMPRSRESALCCGGGGGQMWLPSAGRKRVEGLRLEEARATGAGLVATGCPFCKVMLETAGATAGKQNEIRVRDVSEIVLEALDADAR